MTKYFKETTPYYTYYSAVSDVGTPDDYDPEVTTHPSAYVGVNRAEELPIYGARHWSGREMHPDDVIRNSMLGSHPDDIDEALEKQDTTPQMFAHRPAEITSAFSDPSMRLHMGTLLGQAINEHGKSLRATYDLSPHSSRLARKGIAAGVIQGHPKNPEADEYNGIEFESRTMSLRNGNPIGGDLSPVPKQDVDAGRRTVHNLLRPKPLSPQFQALQQFEATHEAEERGESTYNPANDPNAMRLPGME